MHNLLYQRTSIIFHTCIFLVYTYAQVATAMAAFTESVEHCMVSETSEAIQLSKT